MSFNSMAVVTICIDFGAQEKKVSHCSIVSPTNCHEVMGPDAMILVFWMLPTFSLPSLTFINRLFCSSLSARRVVSSAYLRWLILLLAFFIPACASPVLTFCIMYAAYRLEKAMATHSSTLAWKIPWMEKPGRLQSTGSLGVGHDWVTSLSLSTFMHWRRKWPPTPVFLPGESQGWGSLMGCRLWGLTESDTTEVT